MADETTCDIVPPPGLGAETEDEKELPKPRIAYSKDNPASSLFPSSAKKPHQQVSLKTWQHEPQLPSKVDAGQDSSEGRPTVRFCVFCGTQVPPKLITAKFCVYCGNAHNGQTDEESQELAQPWSPYYYGDVESATTYSSNAEKAMAYQSLMAAMVNPMGYMQGIGTPFQNGYYGQGEWEGETDWPQ